MYTQPRTHRTHYRHPPTKWTHTAAPHRLLVPTFRQPLTAHFQPSPPIQRGYQREIPRMPIVPQSSRMILPPLQLPQSAVRCQTAAAEEQVGLCRGSRRHVLKLAGDRQIELCCARPAVQGKTGMPSGLKCWPCAVVLLHLLSSTDWVKGKTVLELGAGPGLAGLGAALFGGARSTVLTDCNKQVLRLLKHNVMLNHAAAVTVAQLDFTSRFEIEELMEELGMGVGVDVVLACEGTY